MTTLCLNMIVKNESKIIERLLSSVIGIIDTYCICDTGSTDNTIELINNFFIERKMEGKVITEPFKNFEYNRNFALKECEGMSDYVLFLDADMIFEIRNFDKNILSSYDSFHILQGNESFFFNNMRIVRNNGLFKYVGVTHEYISTPNNNLVYYFKKDELFKWGKNFFKDIPSNATFYFFIPINCSEGEGGIAVIMSYGDIPGGEYELYDVFRNRESADNALKDIFWF